MNTPLKFNLDHAHTLKDRELYAFLESHPDPLVQMLLSRIENPALRLELEEAQAEAERQEEAADDLEKEKEDESERAERAEAELLAEQEKHGETDDRRLEAVLRVEQLEQHITRLGLAIPEQDAAALSSTRAEIQGLKDRLEDTKALALRYETAYHAIKKSWPDLVPFPGGLDA